MGPRQLYKPKICQAVQGWKSLRKQHLLLLPKARKCELSSVCLQMASAGWKVPEIKQHSPATQADTIWELPIFLNLWLGASQSNLALKIILFHAEGITMVMLWNLTWHSADSHPEIPVSILQNGAHFLDNGSFRRSWVSVCGHMWSWAAV